MSNGKGSGRRPAVIDDATMTSNWDRVFGKRKPYQMWVDGELRTIGESVINRVITESDEEPETT